MIQGGLRQFELPFEARGFALRPQRAQFPLAALGLAERQQVGLAGVRQVLHLRQQPGQLLAQQGVLRRQPLRLGVWLNGHGVRLSRWPGPSMLPDRMGPQGAGTRGQDGRCALAGRFLRGTGHCLVAEDAPNVCRSRRAEAETWLSAVKQRTRGLAKRRQGWIPLRPQAHRKELGTGRNASLPMRSLARGRACRGCSEVPRVGAPKEATQTVAKPWEHESGNEPTPMGLCVPAGESVTPPRWGCDAKRHVTQVASQARHRGLEDGIQSGFRLGTGCRF